MMLWPGMPGSACLGELPLALFRLACSDQSDVAEFDASPHQVRGDGSAGSDSSGDGVW